MRFLQESTRTEGKISAATAKDDENDVLKAKAILEDAIRSQIEKEVSSFLSWMLREAEYYKRLDEQTSEQRDEDPLEYDVRRLEAKIRPIERRIVLLFAIDGDDTRRHTEMQLFIIQTVQRCRPAHRPFSAQAMFQSLIYK